MIKEATPLDQDSVLALFRETGAMLEGHFELSSGLHSERYFQCALLLADPRRAERLAQALAKKIEARREPKYDVVIGPALGAMIWAHEVARALGARAMFTERKDGPMSLRRGFTLKPGERVLVVEDVLTTGGSAREVIEVMSALDVPAAGVGAIVNRSGGNPFAKEGLPLTALAEVEVRTWKREDCLLCKAGGKAVKPGSRGAPGGPKA
jgi:orotate phosphoribosyltransferase